MDDTGKDLVQAEEELERAKERFHQTLGKIEHSLSPEGLADDASRAIQSKISAVGKASVEVVKERPFALAAGAGAIIAMLARRRLWKASKSLFTGGEPVHAH